MSSDVPEHPTAGEVEAETLAVAGVPSFIEREDAAGSASVVGHVLMVDYDNADPLRAREELSRIPGIGALFESSPGSFHGVVCSVDDLDAHLLRALQLHGDANHVAVAARREYFVLRESPKWRIDSLDADECEEDAPTPEVFDSWARPRDSSGELPPQSWPHFRWLARRLDVDEEERLASYVTEWEDGGLPLLAYQDVAKGMKAHLWGQ